MCILHRSACSCRKNGRLLLLPRQLVQLGSMPAERNCKHHSLQCVACSGRQFVLALHVRYSVLNVESHRKAVKPSLLPLVINKNIYYVVYDAMQGSDSRATARTADSSRFLPTWAPISAPPRVQRQRQKHPPNATRRCMLLQRCKKSPLLTRQHLRPRPPSPVHQQQGNQSQC
jgi:hypothetical protein